ncbi:hypothetical protein [Fibrobacter sp.]
MKPTNEQLEAYKAMAAASPDSMKAKIEANLRATCDKFAGHEDRLEDCMKYLTECARGILNGKNGEVDDDTCYRICRDYFNDEIWAKEDEAKAEREKKRAEMNANAKHKKKAKPAQKKPVPEKKKPEPAKKFKVCPECGKEFINLFKGVCLGCYDKMRKAEEAKRKAEAIKKTPEEIVADKQRALIAENNKKLGIGTAQPIDMFAEAV